nr:hypothetical protein [Tanacetum cinerariifolium]
EGGAEGEHVEEDTGAQGDDTTAQGDDAPEPSPTLPTPPPQQPQDLLSTSQPGEECRQYLQVLHVPSFSSVAHQKINRRVKKLEKENRVRVLKLRRLKKVGTSQRVDTLEDTLMDDASNQGRKIDEMDKDDVVALMDDKEDDKKEEEATVVEDDQVQGRQAESQAKIYKIDMDHASKVIMQEDEPAEVQEVVYVVTTAKLITEVVTATSVIVTAASTIIFAAEPQVHAATITAAPVRVAAASTKRRKIVVIRDPEEELTTSSHHKIYFPCSNPEGGAEGEHVEEDTAAQGDDTTAQGDDAPEPSPTLPTPPPQQPQDLPSTSQVNAVKMRSDVKRPK